MCNCIRDIEEQIKENYLKERNVDLIEDVSLQNTAFMIGPMCSTQLYSPGIIKYNYKNKKGELKQKKKKINVAYQFCPFCGEPYNDKTTEESK